MQGIRLFHQLVYYLSLKEIKAVKQPLVMFRDVRPSVFPWISSNKTNLSPSIVGLARTLCTIYDSTSRMNLSQSPCCRVGDGPSTRGNCLLILMKMPISSETSRRRESYLHQLLSLMRRTYRIHSLIQALVRTIYSPSMATQEASRPDALDYSRSLYAPECCVDISPLVSAQIYSQDLHLGCGACGPLRGRCPYILLIELLFLLSDFS